MISTLPLDELTRLDALHRLQILDTDPEDEYDDLVRLARFVCDVPIALISLVDRERQWFKSRVGLDVSQTPREFAFCAHTICDDQGLVVPDALEDDRFSSNPLVTGEPNIRFYAGVPIAGPEGHPLGSLCVIDRLPRELPEASRVALRVLARQASALIQVRSQMYQLHEAAERQAHVEHQLRESQEKLQLANTRLEQMVRTDALTGLGNRRLFDERLRQEWKLSRQLGVPLSLLMVDIDHFKAINDLAGHPKGDAILRHVGGLLETSTRETDTCTRYGGEEFAILLPATAISEAAELAERLREQVAASPFEDHAVTVSIGAACDNAEVPHFTASSLVGRADEALYAAKHAGRNRIRCAASLVN